MLSAKGGSCADACGAEACEAAEALDQSSWALVTYPAVNAIAHELGQLDERIGHVVHPKGERYGEAWRDAVIREASEPFVCHLGDDDLWLPHHLASMTALLEPSPSSEASSVDMADGEMPKGGPSFLLLYLRDLSVFIIRFPLLFARFFWFKLLYSNS